MKKDIFHCFLMRRDLKKEEDGGDDGKADEQEDGDGEADPFQGTLRDRKREHSSLVWIPQGFIISIFTTILYPCE